MCKTLCLFIVTGLSQICRVARLSLHCLRFLERRTVLFFFFQAKLQGALALRSSQVSKCDNGCPCVCSTLCGAHVYV